MKLYLKRWFIQSIINHCFNNILKQNLFNKKIKPYSSTFTANNKFAALENSHYKQTESRHLLIDN